MLQEPTWVSLSSSKIADPTRQAKANLEKVCYGKTVATGQRRNAAVANPCARHGKCSGDCITYCRYIADLLRINAAVVHRSPCEYEIIDNSKNCFITLLWREFSAAAASHELAKPAELSESMAATSYFVYSP
jgi:hypothetical protein